MIRNFAAHKVLGVLRSTYYHYALRRPEQTMIEKEDELFRPIIRKIFEDTQGRLGAKKIRAIMILLPNKNIGNLVEQKESGDPIRRML